MGFFQGFGGGQSPATNSSPRTFPRAFPSSFSPSGSAGALQAGSSFSPSSSAFSPFAAAPHGGSPFGSQQAHAGFVQLAKRKASEDDLEVEGAFVGGAAAPAGAGAGFRFNPSSNAAATLYDQHGVMRKMKKMRFQGMDGGFGGGEDESEGTTSPASPHPPSSDEEVGSGGSAYRGSLIQQRQRMQRQQQQQSREATSLVISPSRFSYPSGAASGAITPSTSSGMYGGYRMQPVLKHGRFEPEEGEDGSGYYGGGARRSRTETMMAIVEEPTDETGEEDAEQARGGSGEESIYRHKNRATMRTYDPVDLSIRVEEFEEKQAAAANAFTFLNPKTQIIVPDEILRRHADELRWQTSCHALVPYKPPERFIQEVICGSSASDCAEACDEDTAESSESSIEEIFVDDRSGMDMDC